MPLAATVTVSPRGLVKVRAVPTVSVAAESVPWQNVAMASLSRVTE